MIARGTLVPREIRCAVDGGTTATTPALGTANSAASLCRLAVAVAPGRPRRPPPRTTEPQRRRPTKRSSRPALRGPHRLPRVTASPPRAHYGPERNCQPPFLLLFLLILITAPL